MTKQQRLAIDATKSWVEQVVVAYALCPFARVPFQRDTIRYVCTAAEDHRAVKTIFLSECKRLEDYPADELSTTLLILTDGFTDFFGYWDLVSQAENWLEEAGYTGIFQVASFHPDYIFAEAELHAAQNYTNRSPWPMLHLIREAQLEAAIESHSDIEAIPQRNIELMEAKGQAHWEALLQKIRAQEPKI